MASLSKKGDYWRLSFYCSKETPNRKEIYYKRKDTFPKEGYTKNQITEIKKDLEYKYKHGLYNPFRDQYNSEQKKNITLSQAIKLYLKKEKHNLAESTLKSREAMLNALLKEYGNRPLNSLPSDYWNQYINEPELHASKEARRAYIYALYKRLSKEGHNFVIKLELESNTREKKRRSIITSQQWITVEEMEHIIASIPLLNQHNIDKSRAKTRHASARPSYWIEDIIRLAFYTGMRRADLFALRPSWIRDDYKVIRIGGAYNPKSQLPEEIMPTLKEARPLLKKLKDQAKDDKPFFAAHSPSSASKKYKELVRFAIPAKQESHWFHCLRHSFVMYCMDELKLRDRIIMQLTRHKDQRSLNKYKHQNVESALEDIENT